MSSEEKQNYVIKEISGKNYETEEFSLYIEKHQEKSKNFNLLKFKGGQDLN